MVGDRRDEVDAGPVADAQGSGDGAGDLVGVVDRCEVDHPHAVGVSPDHPLGGLDRQAGLAGAAGTDDRHQSMIDQALLDGPLLVNPSDEGRQPRRQVVNGSLGDVEVGIVEQDPLFESPRLAGRLETQLVAHLATQVLVGVQRFGLSTGPVERQHQRPPEPLS